MKIGIATKPKGIALIIVMVAIFSLGILAGGFAYSMKVELRLAQNQNHETEMEWLGRSGVELARYVLAQQKLVPNENWDALNQKWAGGVGVTNEALAEISLEDNPLGSGTFSVKITDSERKFNINSADQIILEQAIKLLGVDPVMGSGIIDSIMDWRDPDDDPHLHGTESDYYLTLNPPYYAKNGPIDELSELLLIRGIMPEIYWGPGGTNHGDRPISLNINSPVSRIFGASAAPQYQYGLVDLFTPLSGRAVNINTASAGVLQLFPGIDANIAQAIVQMRAGPDGVEGNEDDTPFRTVGELVNVPGIGRQAISQVARYFTVNSGTFEVVVTARIGNYQRQYIALLRRNSPRDIQILLFYWR